MNIKAVTNWADRNGWALAFIAVVFAGYALGKDAALRENKAESDLRAGVAQTYSSETA